MKSLIPILAFVVVIAAWGKQSEFNITDGSITKSGGAYQVSTSEMRATIPNTDGTNLEVNFTYLGPTSVVSHLADGSVRHQFGIVLRGQDVCNRVYVMWHFDEAKVYVQVKKNPGQSSHTQCADNGYTTVQLWSVPPIRQSNYLSGRITGSKLAVNAGGAMKVVTLPSSAFTFNGPAGLRSDNARLTFSYGEGQ